MSPRRLASGFVVLDSSPELIMFLWAIFSANQGIRIVPLQSYQRPFGRPSTNGAILVGRDVNIRFAYILAAIDDLF